MKIMSVFGTRPEIIRLSRIFPLLDASFQHVMVNTNQNFTPELNSIFFSELNIRKPDYNLKIKTGQFGTEVAEIISQTEKIIIKEKPDVWVWLGDNIYADSYKSSIIRDKYINTSARKISYKFKVSKWKKKGVARFDGLELPKNYSAALIMPDGKPETPLYLVFDNYEKILKWNRSLRFAISVCTLAEMIKA